MLDDCQRSVEAVHRGHGERGDAGAAPMERSLAIKIESHQLSAGCEVDSAADDVFPSPAVEPVVPETCDDPMVGDEPGSTFGWSQCRNPLAMHSCCRDVGGEAKRCLDPDSLVGIEDDTNPEGP